MPIEEQRFYLPKGDLRDALCLRYGWLLPDIPSKCASGSVFSVDHAMICPKGGFPTQRHNEVRNITAELLTETCTDEPILRPLDGECFQKKSAIKEGEARLDISAREFWRQGERAFFDIRAF